jgi:hypothetical protein
MKSISYGSPHIALFSIIISYCLGPGISLTTFSQTPSVYQLPSVFVLCLGWKNKFRTHIKYW